MSSSAPSLRSAIQRARSRAGAKTIPESGGMSSRMAFMASCRFKAGEDVVVRDVHVIVTGLLLPIGGMVPDDEARTPRRSVRGGTRPDTRNAWTATRRADGPGCGAARSPFHTSAIFSAAQAPSSYARRCGEAHRCRQSPDSCGAVAVGTAAMATGERYPGPGRSRRLSLRADRRDGCGARRPGLRLRVRKHPPTDHRAPDRDLLERRRVHREGVVFEDGEVRPLSGLDGSDLGVELQGERRPEGDRVQRVGGPSAAPPRPAPARSRWSGSPRTTR